MGRKRCSAFIPQHKTRALLRKGIIIRIIAVWVVFFFSELVEVKILIENIHLINCTVM